MSAAYDDNGHNSEGAESPPMRGMLERVIEALYFGGYAVGGEHGFRCPGAHENGEDSPLRVWQTADDRVALDCRYYGCAVPLIAEGLEPHLEGLDVANLLVSPAETGLVLREEALHGAAGDFVRAIGPHTEADPAAILIQLLTAFGNACGRGPGFMVESDQHGTNEFAVIVGESAKARKGTSWGHVLAVMEKADPGFSARLAAGIASGEGLIHAVRDPTVIRRKARTEEEKDQADADGRIEVETDPGVEEKRLLVIETEFAQTLRAMKRDGNTISSRLRNLWDRGDDQTMPKGQPERTTGSLVSVIAHTTARELRREFTETEQGNGFGNRFLWVWATRSKLLPLGGQVDPAVQTVIADTIKLALDHARDQGPLGLNREAEVIWRRVYAELSEADGDDLLSAITARAETHVRRLAVLYALLDCSEVVEVPHLRAALAVWDYCAASAAHIFGGVVGYPLADKMLEAIREADEDKGLTRTGLRAAVGGHVPGSQIDEALGYLVTRGLAVEHRDPTTSKGGRRPHRYTVGPRSKPREGSEETSVEGGLLRRSTRFAPASEGGTAPDEASTEDSAHEATGEEINLVQIALQNSPNGEAAP